jgi:hypothetical protein
VAERTVFRRVDARILYKRALRQIAGTEPVKRDGDVPEVSERRCVQHGYDYSAICSICGKWWREQASPDELRTLKLVAEPLMAGRESAEAEDDS